MSAPILDLVELVDKIETTADDAARVKMWGDWVARAEKSALLPHIGEVVEICEPLRALGSGWGGRVTRLTAALRERKRETPKRPRQTNAPGEVEAKLRRNNFGGIIKSPLNLGTILRLDSRWRGAVRLNDLDGIVYIHGERLDDAGWLRLAEEIDRAYEVPDCKGPLADALLTVGRENRYHPVRDYLTGLRWDRRERLDTMLTRYLGVADSPHARAMGLRWMIAAVARVMKPGCKVDTMLILAGAQGAGKSTFSRIMGGEWFSDAEIDPHQVKEAVLSIQGRWICEVAEWDKWSARDQRTIKAFVSRQEDQIRRPYGRYVEPFPRQTVFVGTTNDDGFLEDPTGSRRFWPVSVGRLDSVSLARDRDQLWAEAMVMYDRGEAWWMSDEEAVAVAADAVNYRAADPWEERIADAIRGERVVKTSDLLKDTLSVPVERHDKAAEHRVGKVLRMLGWTRSVAKKDGLSVRVWVPKVER